MQDMMSYETKRNMIGLVVLASSLCNVDALQVPNQRVVRTSTSRLPLTPNNHYNNFSRLPGVVVRRRLPTSRSRSSSILRTTLPENGKPSSTSSDVVGSQQPLQFTDDFVDNIIPTPEESKGWDVINEPLPIIDDAVLNEVVVESSASAIVDSIIVPVPDTPILNLNDNKEELSILLEADLSITAQQPSAPSLDIVEEELVSDQELIEGISEDIVQEHNDVVEFESDDMNSKTMLKEVFALGLPAVGGLLVDPLMSLVDTACVGQISSLQLAAMAPATSVCQYVFQVFFFLSAATTNLVASNPPDAPGLDDTEVKKRVDFNEQVLSAAMFLAVVLGTIVATGLIGFSNPLLTLAGCSDVKMLSLSRNYLQIRAIGVPLVLIATALQGSSLGRNDSWTPLRIFAFAGLFNLVGDVYLMLMRGMGVSGAAIATTVSQAIAAGYFAFKSMRLSRKPSEASKPNRGVSLAWRGLPTKALMKTYGVFAVTLFMRSVGCMSMYSILTRFAAGMGSIGLAAHQVVLQVFWMLSFFAEAMSVASQALVARDSENRIWRVPKLVKMLFGIAAGMGGVSALLTWFVLTNPGVSSALVADTSVRAVMAKVAPLAALSQISCSLAVISEGMNVGLGSIKSLPATMIGSAALTTMGLAMATRRGMGLPGVWMCANGFFIIRTLLALLASKKLRGFLFKRVQRRNADEESSLVTTSSPVVLTP